MKVKGPGTTFSEVLLVGEGSLRARSPPVRSVRPVEWPIGAIVAGICAGEVTVGLDGDAGDR
jgi:hypothetical protein